MKSVTSVLRDQNRRLASLMAVFFFALATFALVVPPSLQWTRAAREQLSLYRTADAERFGCMYGLRLGGRALVTEIRPATVRRRAHSWSTETTCTDRRSLLGVIHNHPGGVRCFYVFPGTSVPSSDLVSFRMRGNPLDAIVCDDHVLWILRDERPRQARL